MNARGLIEVARFYDLNEARIARSALEAHGIACMLFDENHHSIQPYLQVALGGIRLMAAQDDAEAAQTFMNNLPPSPESSTVPALPQGSGGWFSAMVTFLMTMIGGAPMKIKERSRDD